MNKLNHFVNGWKGWDGRTVKGRFIKRFSRFAYEGLYYLAILSFVTLICWGIFA